MDVNERQLSNQQTILNTEFFYYPTNVMMEFLEKIFNSTD